MRHATKWHGVFLVAESSFEEMLLKTLHNKLKNQKPLTHYEEGAVVLLDHIICSDYFKLPPSPEGEIIEKSPCILYLTR